MYPPVPFTILGIIVLAAMFFLHRSRSFMPAEKNSIDTTSADEGANLVIYAMLAVGFAIMALKQ